MLKAITFPAERAEEAFGAVETLVELSSRQLEMCSQAMEELELSGELRKDFMKRQVRTQSEIRKARSRLKDLASSVDPAPKASP